MNLKPWAKMPTRWIQDGRLKNFRWKDDGSAGTAALMIYFTLCQFASERPLRPGEVAEPDGAPAVDILPPPGDSDAGQHSGDRGLPIEAGSAEFAAAFGNPVLTAPWARHAQQPNHVLLIPGGVSIVPHLEILSAGAGDQDAGSIIADALIARLTYGDIMELTTLSRDRISAGLQKLIEEKMIWRLDGASSYGLAAFGRDQQGKMRRWVKLPGRALTSLGSTHFAPFTHFNLRSKHELNALKLHLYYAHTRGKDAAYSEVSHETIFARTGVQERDIARANSLLLSSGILSRTRGLPSEDARQHEANKYYLSGYEGFFFKKASA